MFDLITGNTRHLPRKTGLPLLISSAGQLTLAGALLVPVLLYTDTLPDVPTMMAFVATAPAPAPPPPPPPPAPARTQAAQPTKPVPTTGAAPVEPPTTIKPELPNDEGEIGIPGGVEGGVPGGVVGGVVGGLPADIPPPPPPPPPPAPAARPPLRVGGDIKAPALLHRVEPVYPPLAVAANIRGMVILEALVDRDGHVADVKVLRSANKLLDIAAMDAVRQWQYRPVTLNGLPEPFILTVVLTFDFRDS